MGKSDDELTRQQREAAEKAARELREAQLRKLAREDGK